MSGAIMLGFSTRSIVKNKKEIMGTALFVSVVIFAVGILIGLMLARHISKPVNALRDAAEKVGNGDLSQKISVITRDEIGDLSVAFNKMVDDLSRARMELREQKQVIEEKHEEIQEQHRQLLQSIEYARRIQGSILPPRKIVKQHLEDSFILYLPKDIVAGDFYWMAEYEDEILFAACDCTGHGVPGAMVSVICSNALNKAVKELNLLEPASILDKVCELVMTGFQGGGDEDEFLRDGMDISLCRLNKETRRLQWAGAYNPLWIAREGNNGSEIIEFKADKQSIGNSAEPFTNYETFLEPGDFLYLFTDGYRDQFGGPMAKKLNRNRFRELLMSMHKKPVSDQHEALLVHHNQWKGNLSQVDDICIIGVRIS
jgi:serine phosphatase RsbU (regulator of sigma subunit)